MLFLCFKSFICPSHLLDRCFQCRSRGEEGGGGNEIIVLINRLPLTLFFLIYSNIHLDFLCRCAHATKDKKYTHFGIQEFGECLSGPQVKSTYDKQGEEKQLKFRPESKPWVGCIDTDFNRCKQPSTTCIGQELTNFVYGLENGK